MVIDLKNLEKYNAKVLALFVVPSTINHNTFWSTGGAMPHLGPWKNSFKNLEAALEFRGTRYEIELNKSELLKDLLEDGTINDGPFSYVGAYQVKSIKEQLNGFETITLAGSVAHLGQEELISLSGTKSFTNKGTAKEGPCKLVLEGTGELVVNGESFGIVSNITLNSFTGEILPAGAVTGTTFIGLPKLKDGANNIALGTGLTGTLTYRPLYL